MNVIIKDILTGGIRFFAKSSNYIWYLLTAGLDEWNNGVIWEVVLEIASALKDIGYGLLVVFFGIGLIKEISSFTEFRNPGTAIRFFLRYAGARLAVSLSTVILSVIYDIASWVVNRIHGAGFSNIYSGRGAGIPENVISAINGLSWYASLVGIIMAVIVFVVSLMLNFSVMMTAYTRFFKLYTYVALAPVMLSPLAGEGTQSSGWQFVKGFIGACLEATIIALAMVMYSKLVTVTTISDWINNGSYLTVVLGYMAEVILHMLIMAGLVKGAAALMKEMAAL